MYDVKDFFLKKISSGPPPAIRLNRSELDIDSDTQGVRNVLNGGTCTLWTTLSGKITILRLNETDF